jgi:asparagine synthase (glutamine-hydrolysing)
MMDPVVGGSHITWAYSSQSDKWSFDTFFARINRYGIQIDVLKRLLRREAFGDLVEETVARIKKAYESFAELESQRAWCFDLYHRQRFHVGGDAWAFSFGAWPVLPVLDRELLESVGGMPAATLIDRRAQKELLCNRFPELAALPLDRNSHNTIALKPTLPSWVKYRLREHLRDRLDPVRDWLPVIRRPKAEDRYYYRTYDLNGPGWRAVRHLAEPHRERVLHLFDKKSLGTLLPPSHVPLQLQDEIIDSSGLKSMLGFLLWSQDHLN